MFNRRDRSDRLVELRDLWLAVTIVAPACTPVDQRTTGPGPDVVEVVLEPSSATVPGGSQRQFNAYGKLANGDSVGVSVIYGASGGTVDAGGLYTAGPTAGTYRVIATQSGGTLADTSPVTITVSGPPTLGQVVLLPAAVTLSFAGTQQFVAYGRMTNGDSVAVSVTYDATGGTITGAGLYTAGQTIGGYRVIATETGGALADTSSVFVTDPVGATVLVGAGDIADCGSNGDEQTAALLDGIAGTVFTAGDNVYSSGTATQFTQCYEPTWGRHKARTRPSPGNHDYDTSGASGYYGYFGAAAGDPDKGYYSYDLGDWHIVSLNSHISMSAGSPQEQWLRADLAASTKRCTLAYWHHPRFSSGSNHGSSTAPQPLWQALYDAGAEIVISGHDHTYERFAPQTPTGGFDTARGIREFVVGSGGRSHYGFGTPLPNSEVRNGTTYGVLKLTLSADSYAWEFVPVAGETFNDGGTGACR